jgi:formylglycine-generating enzyme required for sulfatase activity
VSAEKAKCEKELCAGKPSWELCREKLPSEVECAGGRRQTVSCVGVKPPWREGTGEMVSIPAGTFQMGSNDGEWNEQPVHRVSVAAFQMDVTEVTVDAYAACVRAGSCTAAETGEFCKGGEPGKGNHPINCVDWNQATAYCGWAKKRLPTEEEWEYAARGTDGRKYPWGNGAPGSQLCWKRWESKLGTCAVGDYKAGASPFGVLDLAGNVWEWTSSGYSNGYSNSRANDTRVIRGGGWYDDYPSLVRAAFRRVPFRGRALVPDFYLGFRCSG